MERLLRRTFETPCVVWVSHTTRTSAGFQPRPRSGCGQPLVTLRCPENSSAGARAVLTWTTDECESLGVSRVALLPVPVQRIVLRVRDDGVGGGSGGHRSGPRSGTRLPHPLGRDAHAR